MTVVVAFLCSDGVVVAADSMLTPSIGGINVGHHHIHKIHVLPGPQIFGLAGDIGQAARFRLMAEGSHAQILNAAHALDYPIALTKTLIAQFQSTGIGNSINVNTILSYLHGGNCHCCVFEGAIQPRLLDAQHYYVALGSGKLSADPFLRFLDDIFCRGVQPKVREAVFLATWTIQHVIDTNPGGVAAPIRVAIFEKDNGAAHVARVLADTEIQEHLQAIESAADALRNWKQGISAGAEPAVVPEPPTAPA